MTVKSDPSPRRFSPGDLPPRAFIAQGSVSKGLSPRVGVFPGLVLLLLLSIVLGGCSTLGQQSGKDPLEANAYGIWTGQLPCVGCPGVTTRLILWRDPDFFRLTETYLDTAGGPKTFTSFGKWQLEKTPGEPSLGHLFLITDDASRTLYLERLPSGSLRMLDDKGDPLKPEQDYTLDRTRRKTEE